MLIILGNFIFSNDRFLKNLTDNPFSYYNAFNCHKQTKEIIDKIGKDFVEGIYFKYNPDKRIRATFITLKNAIRECDVKTICILYNGDRRDFHCYFYELYENDEIGCVEVVNNFNLTRHVLKLNVGDDIDEYFEDLCSRFDKPYCDAVTMLYYRYPDNTFRLLDMALDDLDIRSKILLYSVAEKKYVNIEGTKFIKIDSTYDGSYIIARNDNGNYSDIELSDILLLKNQFI